MKSVKIFLFIFVFILLISTLLAFQMDSPSYSGRAKFDSGAVSSNSSSASFAQRFIAGVQAVSRYVSSLFSGRFGILDDVTTPVPVEENISICRDLNQTNTIYNLNQNVSAAGTCFNITANNVTLNCNGYTINYSQSITGYAVKSIGYNVSEIKDCITVQGRTNAINSYAIYLINGYNTTIENNTLTTYGSTTSNANNYGIYLNNQKVNVIYNNGINTTGRASYAIYLNNKANSTNISNNRIQTSGVSSYGIYSSSSSLNTLQGNNITTSGNSAYGIYLLNSQKNNITSNELASDGIGVYLIYITASGVSSAGNKVSNNDLYTYGGTSYGIYLYKNILGSEISENMININGASSSGLYISTDINHTKIDSNIFNITGGSSYGIRLITRSCNNNLTNNNITALNTGGSGIYLAANADLNNLINNTIQTTSYSLSINDVTSNLIYNNLLNSTVRQIISIKNYVNLFNTTKTDLTPNKNIILGSYLGGNFWANSFGTGFSQTCKDENNDGICDTNYTMNSYNIDYLALTKDDNVNPAISIWSPDNDTHVNGNVPIIANASDNFAVVKVVFQYSNSTVAWTNLTGCNFTLPNYQGSYRCIWRINSSFSGSAEGYDIKAVAYDVQGNIGEDIKHYVIDRNLPIIEDMSIVYPGTQSSVRDGQNITLKAIVADSPYIASGINNVQANLLNINTSTWSEMSFESGSKDNDLNSTWNLTIKSNKGVSNLNTLLGIRIYDTAYPTHNIRTGSNWGVIVDNNAPTNSSGLKTTSGVYNNTQTTFAVSVSDNYDLDHYIFSNNWSGIWVNSSPVDISGKADYIEYSKIVYTGNFSYKFFVFDDAGNMNETATGNIEVLGARPTPVIYLVSPADATISNVPSKTFQFYYVNSLVDNCTLILNGTANETISSPANETLLSFTTKNLNDGDYSWYVSCDIIEQEGEDYVTNTYTSDDIYNLKIDTIPPAITIDSPENLNYSSSNNYFNLTINEDASWCGFSLNNAENVSMVEENTTYFHYTQTSLPVGTHSVVFSCNDTANNYNSSEIDFSILFPVISINLTSPYNNQEIVRGSGIPENEDSKGYIENRMNITAKLVNNSNNGILGATCYFYFNDSFIGESFTNSTGDCNVNYDKTPYSAGIYNLSVNYTYLVVDITKNINKSDVNFSLVVYNLPNYAGNKGAATQYVNGQVAILYFNVTKTNSSGTYFYDPLNISINATRADETPYPNGDYVSGKRAYKITTGQYESHVIVNKVFGSVIRWDILVSDDDYTNYLATTVHADIAISDPPVCGNTLIETPETCDDGNVISGDGCSSLCQTEIVIPPTSCFPGYTLITMADGNKKEIKDVKVGDIVLSYDLKENKLVNAKVLEMESPVREGLYEINGFLNVTDEHPFYTMKKDGIIGWAAIDKVKGKIDLIGSEIENEPVYYLEVGDKLFTSERKWIEIYSIKYHSVVVKTYNLKTVDKYNKFFANNILVHNKDGGGCTYGSCSNPGTSESKCSGDKLSSRTCGSDSCWSAWSSEDCGEGKTCEIVDLIPKCVEINCDSAWKCGDWSKCYLDSVTNKFKQSRICKNAQCDLPDRVEIIDCISPCDESWTCDWTICSEEDIYSYPYNCIDKNNCGTTNDKPKNSVSCEDCIKDGSCNYDCNWKCEEWGNCNADYSINDALNDVQKVNGIQERLCIGLTGCNKNITETKECDIGISITANISEWCNETYVEIYNKKTESLVSRVKQEEIIGFTDLKRIDILFILTNFAGYCDYCFDGIKDNDETSVDCGGNNCPECINPYWFFDWLIYAIIASWFMLLIFIFIYYRTRKEETKEKFKRGISEEASSLVSIFKPSVKREEGIKEVKEGKITSWIKKILISPISNIIRIIKGKPSEERIKLIKIPVAKPRKFSNELLLEELKKKLALWRRRGYYGTTKLEEKIERLEFKIKRKKPSFKKFPS